MELLASIPFIGGFLATVIPFLVVLGIVVFVHEYGHYIVGRWCGIHADVFSIGYGRPLKQWTDKRGTVWQIALLPLGGYVKFLGDENASSFGNSDALDGMSSGERSRSFPGATVWRRALTVAAGPVFNFILSIVVFAGLILWQGKATEPPVVGDVLVPMAQGQDLRKGDEIIAIEGREIAGYLDIYDSLDAFEGQPTLALTVRRNGQLVDITAPFLLPPLISGVTPFSPAADAGLASGDLILALGDTPLSSFSDLREVVLASEGVALPMTILRNGQEQSVNITPEITETPKPDGEGWEKRVMIGVSGSLAFLPETTTPGIISSLVEGTERMWRVITMSLDGLWHILRGAFGAEDGLSPENINGPLGIAQISGESARQGIENFISLIALLSTAIGMLNLFPIPILDGGHLVIFGYEALTGRPPHEKVLNFAMSVGFVLLMALMLFATYNDIMRI